MRINSELPWKRGLDILCILFTLPLLLPLMFLIAVLIKFSSRGPVFFRQERIGLKGKSFMLLKFRSMKVGAETAVHQKHIEAVMISKKPMSKLDKGDSRLIRGGSLLRSSGLDELPQLINVLLGDMSLVGPRPCLPYEYAKYSPSHKRRCETLPGLTGFWQVKGKNKTTFPQMIAMDCWYVKNKSVQTDLWIMLMTFPAIGSQIREMLIRRKRTSVTWVPPLHPATTTSDSFAE